MKGSGSGQSGEQFDQGRQMSVGVQDAFVGIDVAFAKRKPLPVSVCVELGR